MSFWDRATNLVQLNNGFGFYNIIVYISEKFPEVWTDREFSGMNNPTSVFLEDVEISLLIIKLHLIFGFCLIFRLDYF